MACDGSVLDLTAKPMIGIFGDYYVYTAEQSASHASFKHGRPNFSPTENYCHVRPNSVSELNQ
eukprot:5891353-Amphidinium_carterae.1